MTKQTMTTEEANALVRNCEIESDTLRVDVVASIIADLREGVLMTDPQGITPFNNGQLIGSIHIAKAIARKLPANKQRGFLALCGIPNATL